ncbi:unnamed protein product [Staurois parvus]|uniref:Uncharacterized protein n=1 Tax=Staurois parvus TaxID=386267 RepID=A0ABN9F7R2_9NEOB|nr:unnamed protein product [Staurois parvus]
MLSLVCIARDFFGGKGACVQHRANQHRPDRGSGVNPRFQRKMKTPPTRLTSAQLNTDRRHKTAIYCCWEKVFSSLYLLK